MNDLLRSNSEVKKKIDKTIKKDEDGISSISTEDAIILLHLKYLTENGFPMLGEILSEYKTTQSDQDICERLEDLVKVVEKSVRSGGDGDGTKMIKIGEEYLIGSSITSISLSDGYDENDVEFPIRYNIMINKTTNDKVTYANKEIGFFSPSQREIALKKLMAQMEQFHNYTFIK
tara:strand:- start:23 stop:547 length:525 start_codon:yes stop_codon:yes gene_type:complete